MGKFRVRRTNDNKNWVVTDGSNFANTNKYIDRNGNEDNICYTFSNNVEAQTVLNLYLSKQEKEEKQDDKIRQFKGGAIRDADDQAYYDSITRMIDEKSK